MATSSLRAGSHEIGTGNGAIRVRTYREGLAQRVGHDLIIDVREWKSTVEVAEDGSPSVVELEVDPRSLQALEGLHGVKPLTDNDRASIRKDIDEKVLRGQPIRFQSSSVKLADNRLTVRGELTLAGATREAGFELELADDGRVSGTLPLTQEDAHHPESLRGSSRGSSTRHGGQVCCQKSSSTTPFAVAAWSCCVVSSWITAISGGTGRGAWPPRPRSRRRRTRAPRSPPPPRASEQAAAP